MNKLATITGLVLALSALALACGVGGPPTSVLHPPALLVVAFGALAYVLLSHPWPTLVALTEAPRSASVAAAGPRLIELARRFRLEGLRGLERELDRAADPLERQGLQLMTSGADAVELSSALDRTAQALQEADAEAPAVWRSLANGAVNAGVVGTLAGMIQALTLAPAAQASDGLAGAFTATLYGLLLAQFVCLPLAHRRLRAARRAAAADRVWIEGLLAIQAGEHPYRLAERLQEARSLRGGAQQAA